MGKALPAVLHSKSATDLHSSGDNGTAQLIDIEDWCARQDSWVSRLWLGAVRTFICYISHRVEITSDTPASLGLITEPKDEAPHYREAEDPISYIISSSIMFSFQDPSPDSAYCWPKELAGSV